MYNIIKYHKNLSFNKKHINDLKIFIDKINILSFKYSYHAKEKILLLINDYNYFYNFMHNLKINYNDIFEYTINNDKIEKIAIRIKYNNEKDIILSLSMDKKIITIYLNNIHDKHITLNKNNYIEKG